MFTFYSRLLSLVLYPGIPVLLQFYKHHDPALGPAVKRKFKAGGGQVSEQWKLPVL